MVSMKLNPTLLKSCINEERKAQYELYKLCYSMILSVCLRYERNKEDAEFLLNKAFHKILTHLHTYDTKIPFEAWIRRISINTCIDEYRKNQRSKIDYIEEPMRVAPLLDMNYNEAEERFDAEELLNMIKALPPASQKVFNLYIIDGYNHKEIGEQLGMSEGTSKWHLSSARKKLQEMMRKAINNVAILLWLIKS